MKKKTLDEKNRTDLSRWDEEHLILEILLPFEMLMLADANLYEYNLLTQLNSSCAGHAFRFRFVGVRVLGFQKAFGP